MASPVINSGSVATFTVKVGGTAVPDLFSIFSVHVERNVNRISSAGVVVLDGDSSTGEFAASSSSAFVSGAVVYETALTSSGTEIDLTSAGSGVYFVSVMTEKGAGVKRVVVR